MVFFFICTCISTCRNINKFVIPASRSYMTNFGLAYSFLRFIKSQNYFKEVITRFQNYVYFPWYSGVSMLQIRDIYKHMCVQYLKVIFASSEMILTVFMGDMTYLTHEKRLQWQESLKYIGGWNPTNAVSGASLFQENLNVNLRHW